MQNILSQALRAGVRFQAVGDKLRITAPQGAMTPELREGIQRHKQAILDHLRAQDRPAEEDTLPILKPDPARRHDPFPLSDIQHAYWLGRNGGVAYSGVSTHFYFELDSEGLDISRLNDALCRLIDRHEMLRAVFDKDGTQRILLSVPRYEIAVHDLSTEGEMQIEHAIQGIRDELSHQVLPSDRWPLFDIRATRLPHHRIRLHISLDFLIIDGWSMFLLFDEWHQLYRHPDVSLPEIDVSYRDYLLAERNHAGSAAYKRSYEYWMNRVDTLPPAPALPVRASSDGKGKPSFSRRRAVLDQQRWEQLKLRARKEGLTPSGLLMAAYVEVLARWSNTRHFTLNLTLFNRMPLHEDVGRLIGDFTSSVLVEVDHRKSGTTFRERALQLQRQLADDLDHREVSGVEVMRQWSKINDTPLQAVMPFVFTSGLVFGGSEGLDAGCIERFGPMVYGISQTPQVWLDHQVMEVNGTLTFNWDALDAVFEEGVLDAMLGSFIRLLEELADQEEVWNSAYVARLPTAVEAEREAINRTASTYDECLLHEGFMRRARRFPEAMAIFSEERNLTYGELLTESMAIAGWLRKQGILKGELVAVLMHKGWEQVAAVLGILMAGGAYLPVNANLPVSRQEELLHIGDVRHILCQPYDVPQIAEPQGKRSYRILEVHPSTADHPALPLLDDGLSPNMDDLAYVIFTSGTTGVPKGVMISHRGAVNTIEHINRLFQVGPQDRVLAVSSLSFDLSVYDIFGILSAGGAIAIPDRRKGHDPVYWSHLIAKYGITLWNSAPQLMRMLMDNSHRGGGDETTLRAALLSGDWITLDLPDRIRKAYPACRVTSLGGATEASIWSIYYPIEEVDPQWSSIPYGKPLPNQTIWVYDEEFRICPDYVRGRIFIGGIGLAQGYWKDPDKTSERFVTHPVTGERLYNTGDLGCYTPGSVITFLGRDDNQVKIRGHRIELGEIAAVLRQHPEIREAVVTVTGSLNEHRQLAAYIEPEVEIGLLGSTDILKEPQRKLSELFDVMNLRAHTRQLTGDYEAAWTLLEDYYAATVFKVLYSFGVRGEIGELIVVDRLLAAGVASRYERWLKRALSMLVEDGYARLLRPGAVELTSPLPEPDLVTVSREVKERLETVLAFEEDEADWLVEAVERIDDILRERIHSAEIYTADATARIYQRLFPDNHEQLKIALRKLMENQRGARVLEVGAGLGSATQHLLPIVAEAKGRYVFTDISEYFLQRAEGLFLPLHPEMEFRLLNLDVRPELQGMERGSFDMIVASSMMHDVMDIRQALEHLRSLLRPGGQLILLEETRFFRSFDLHMGLQQGFDVFRDEELRSTHCLLTVEQWERALRDCGFVDVVATSTPGSVADYLGFHVLIAEGPPLVQRLDVQAVRQYVGDRLPEYMVPKVVLQMDKMPVSANGKIDYKALPAIPEYIQSESAVKIEPRHQLERCIYDAWSKVMRGKDFGVTDNFFDLGGDSLVATELLREMNQVLPFELEMHEFFEHQTIEALSIMIRKRLNEEDNDSAGQPGLMGEALESSVLSSIENHIPLSDLQLGFFMADDPYMEFHVRPHLYMEYDKSRIDPVRYEKAWNQALLRHRGEIAVLKPDGTLSTLDNVVPLRCKVADLRGLSEAEAVDRLMHTREEMMRSELPLDRWPWIDLRLTLWSEKGTDKTRIHYNHNNFFWDGHSVRQLLKEVDLFYNDEQVQLPSAEVTLKAAATALEQLSASPEGQASRLYWESRLPSLPGPPSLPVRPHMERRCRSTLHRREQIIGADIWLSFKKQARSHGVTPSSAMFTVYAELLGAWSNSRHFVISNMMTRRMVLDPNLRDVYGNFSSTYPMEVDFRSDCSFADRARRLQGQIIRDSQHLHWGGMQVIQAYSRHRGGFGQAPIPFVIGSGLFMEAFQRPDFSCLETSQVMLDHQFWELENGSLFYVLDTFEEFFPDGLIDDMWAAYASLIERLAHDHHLWQREIIPLVSNKPGPGQNDSDANSHVNWKKLDSFLQETAAVNPGRAAAITTEGRLTYGELAAGSGRIAAELQAAGAGRGDTVAVVVDRGVSLLRAVYGVLQAGSAYVPIDPRLPEERRNYLLANSGAEVVLTEPRYLSDLAWPGDLLVLPIGGRDGSEGSEGVVTVQTDVTVTDLAYIIYTSGSTGLPKGVMIDHRGAANTILDVNERFGVGPEDRLFGVSSFGFDLSVYDVFGAAASGAAVVYPDPEQALNPAHWLDRMIEEGVTVWNSAPPLAVLLAEAAQDRGIELPALRLVLLSGDWIPLDLPARLRQVAPQAKLVSLGGATEASIWSILYEIGDVNPSWSSIPYGYPMKNQSWHILDEWGRPAPEWVAGELYIGGIGLAQGYWRDEEKTKASFISHPDTGERIYRTGDIGRYLPGGVIEFLGRKDSQVKLQGHRIELGEIEAVLAGYPGVQASVAHVQQGERGAELVAYVVPAAGVTLDAEQLRRWAGRKLPDYMVPRGIAWLDRLPLNANGKIDRKALPRIEEPKRPKEPKLRIDPLDKWETELLDIWRQVLKLESIAVSDDFFDLGGQSFEAVRMVGLIAERLGRTLSLGDIWEERTIIGLAARLRSEEAKTGKAEKTRCLVPMQEEGQGTPIYLVHPAGGHVMCYGELGKRLNRPVLAFQAPGVDGREAPLQTIPDMANRYVELLSARQPEGPVIVGGWSSGGLIAYEMAVQLQEQGRQVEGVIIVDSPAPLVHDPIEEAELFQWFLGDLNLPEAVYEQVAAIEWTGDAPMARVAAWTKEAVGLDAEQLETIYGVFCGIVQGSRSYHAASTPVDMLVLRARDGEVSEFAAHPYREAADWGWKRVTAGHVDGKFLSGTHYTLLASDAVGMIAEEVEQWLKQTNKIISS
ncbi:amino acid adenylation domain-containing protein [Paenibacillus sp. NPDC093718]|uniref:amino acid adenylation domain-containing protein n=1 Tax=Paenibacillus sp. NPDC093718 TaxID=3390601 RepID=UPI003CFC98A6